MKNPNDPAENPSAMAFPYEVEGRVAPGLSKREYFAAQALRGAIEWDASHNDPRQTDPKTIASNCVALADAVIAELSK